jgi:acyl-CoA thioester hydrolase
MIEPAKIQVRLTDIDILGHVNNAIYLSYFEMTRIHYFNELVGYNTKQQKSIEIPIKIREALLRITQN